MIYFIYQVGNLGIGLWMPQIIKGMASSLTNFQVGLIGMIPYAIATVAMILWSRNSDRTGERRSMPRCPCSRPRSHWAATGLTVQPGAAWP